MEGFVLLESLRTAQSKRPYIIYAGSNSPEHKRNAIERGAFGATSLRVELFELVVAAIERKGDEQVKKESTR